MKQSTFEIRAFAENKIWHRSHNFVLSGDEKFMDVDRNDASIFYKKPDLKDYATQAEANKFAAHTDVKFTLVEIVVDLEDEESEIEFNEIETLKFKVEDA